MNDTIDRIIDVLGEESIKNDARYTHIRMNITDYPELMSNYMNSYHTTDGDTMFGMAIEKSCYHPTGRVTIFGRNKIGKPVATEISLKRVGKK